MSAVTTPIAASAHEDAPHDDNLITAQFDPSMPTDAPIFGVNAASFPWVPRHGEVTIREDGRTDVRLRGLHSPQADGSQANPLSSITASLYCGGTLAARSSAQAMSVPGGDARSASGSLSQRCVRWRGFSSTLPWTRRSTSPAQRRPRTDRAHSGAAYRSFPTLPRRT